MDTRQRKFSYLRCLLVLLHDLAIEISSFQTELSPLPRSDPLRVLFVQALAMVQFKRYRMLKDSEDVEYPIFHFLEAIFFPNSLNIIQAFEALIDRAVAPMSPDSPKMLCAPLSIFVIYVGNHIKPSRPHVMMS